MRCCVPFCKNTADNVRTAGGTGKDEITFHGFPSEGPLRAAWLKALGKQDTHLPDSAVVCSQHFLSDDIRETEGGSKQIAPGAIPSTVLVCTMCLDSDSKQLLMSKYKLDVAYQQLVGLPLCALGSLKQTVCVQCAHRLTNVTRLRDDSLRTRSLMMDLLEKHEVITNRHIQIINREKNLLKSKLVIKSLGPDHFDLHIVENDVDHQTKVHSAYDTTVVKTEDFDPTAADGEVEVKNEYDDEFVVSHGQEPACEGIKLETKMEDDSDSSNPHLVETYSIPWSVRAAPYEDDTLKKIKRELDIYDSNNKTNTFPHYLVKLNKEPERSQSCSSYDKLHVGTASTESHCETASASDVTGTHNRYMSNALQSETGLKYNNKLHTQLAVSSLRAHSENKLFTCDVCKNVFKQKSLLVKHMKSHSERKIFTCKFCQLKFTYKSHLLQHVRFHTGEKPYSCNLCECKFTTKFHLVRHMRTHTGEKPYSCNLCEYECSQNSQLVRHMRTHTGEKPYSCNYCEYKCFRNSQLVSHMRTHHVGEKPYSCDLCEYKSARRTYLVIHMRTHTGEKPFFCTLCEYKCTRNELLVLHMRSHTGEKPYACNICELKFSLKSNLTKHMRIHTGEKPHSCDTCQRKFTRKSDLATHLLIHTGEQPYSCNLCDYKCSKNAVLKRHMRTHTGEKPYSCNLCEFKCALSSNLNRHMRTHTGEK
ncbi:zinc finger protein 271 isoform X4 [Bicyclus anynana]|uniref:Zinc finger protein 271 isoform X4 n=1 Tax=Bicyclus anynana TaxID=110368 RepID=A0ABM3M3A2_BICAN|nr:zinc finger protein 271 isoform X4 [Bicyclus anynana]